MAADTVEFKPSGGFVLLGAVSPGILIALGVFGFVRAGEFRILPAVIGGLGVVLAAVAAYDIPHTVVVDAVGVHRRCLFRRQSFGWDDVIAFRRPRPPRGRRIGSMGGVPEVRDPNEEANKAAKGGLLVETRAHRQYLLSHGRERPATYEAIREVVRNHAPGLSMPGPPYYPRSESSL